MDRDREPAVDYLIAIDLAQSAGGDYTALAVLQRTEPIDGTPAHYAGIHLERWRSRDTAMVPERTRAVWRQIEHLAREAYFQRHGTIIGSDPWIRLVVDVTGVGPFGTDPLKKAGFEPTGIVIHGGDAVSHPDPHTYRVPKRDLAGAVHVLLESGRLKIANRLPEAATLKAELENFRAKITLTGHDTYGAGAGEAWREGAHDDLVLAVAIGCWLGESRPFPRLDPVLAASFVGLPG
jgi:hypothetical protein